MGTGAVVETGAGVAVGLTISSSPLNRARSALDGVYGLDAVPTMSSSPLNSARSLGLAAKLFLEFQNAGAFLWG